MYHEDTLLGQEELKEGQGDILDAVSLQHEESSQNQSDMLANQQVMMSTLSLLQDALVEGAKANGNAILVKKLEKKIEELQKTSNMLRSKWMSERKASLKTEQELKATKSELARVMTPKKPGRGLTPLPTNFSAIPSTKRMVVAEMKHVGLKTDDALVDAEGVKRGNSSTLLP